MGFLSSISQKIALAIMMFLAPIAGVSTTGAIPSHTQTAMVNAVVMPSSTVATVVVVVPSVEPNLLPTVHLAKHPIVLRPTPKKVVSIMVAIGASTTTTTQAAAPKVITPKATITKPAATSTPIPATVLPQWIFDRTTSALTQQRDGTWRVTLNTQMSATQTITWHFTDTNFGGGSISPFSVSYICDPPADIPDPASFDQNLIFEIRTPYACTVTLTPLTGTDKRPQSKTFSFQTGPGQLMVTPPSAMNTVLQNDQNDGGFVFTNLDSQPLTITGVTLDFFYQGLSNTDGPLVLRLADPATGQSLFDYHLESLPTDPGQQFTLTKTGIEVPLTFAIPGNGHRMLIVQMLGVHKMSVTGLDPAVTVTLRQATLSQPDIKTIFTTPQITWSCILPTTGYDPNATSSSQVCKG